MIEARVLLETAITAGYRNARLHVALAYICAIQDGVAAGETVLARMISNSTGSPWTAFLKLLENPNELDAAANGLILGINESSVWTSLGSYAKKFIADKNLSEVLYRGAVQLDGHNPVALTNLARFLIENGSEQALVEARKCLQKASTFSEKRFRWWRTVQADLHKLTGQVIEEIQPHEPAVEAADSTETFPVHFSNLRSIRSRFRQLQGLQDEQKRGYELEQLFCALAGCCKTLFEGTKHAKTPMFLLVAFLKHDFFSNLLASLTFGASLGSYQIKRPGGGHRQVDAYFEHLSFAYRVECKWRREETTPNDIIIFASKLDATGVSGLFVSMAGFTNAAIAEARLLAPKKMIIFLNGEEAQKVLVGEINFDQLLTVKETWFRSKSEPYHQVMEVSEVA
ncbi:MAG: restriction endonuclease [Verrucomicrobia bacterium]|nr:restriction endonuclease [Verrucomicrobiota bacterium]